MTRSTTFRLLAAVAVMVGLLAPLLGPAATPASAVSDVQIQRLGGADRYETAADVARESHPGAQTALIANGTNFPDALAGSTLAGAVNAPILLVTPTSIPAATSTALSDLGVDDVVILGGPNAVSTQVENQLRTNYSVTRVQGDDRYKTAVEIARRAAVGGIGTVDGLRTAFISTGLNYPDALGAGPLAYEGNLPSLLTRTNDLPAEVAQLIRDLNIEHVVILGGTQAVSATVEQQIEATGASTERLNGRNRAETATFVADFALGRMDFDGVNVILARGDNFPDALAGGPLGGERRAVILLTATNCQLAIETRNWLEEHFGTIARIFILGGTSAICDAVAREAEAAAETNNLPPSQVDLTISGGSMNGGPKWQYQQSGASPSKSLTLSAFVSSDPPEGSDEEAERVPAGREDVIFNVRPTQGDNSANTELNLSARTDTNGVARVTYTRAQPGTDIITVRLRDETTINDSGVGRWNTDPMPLSLTPDTAQRLDVNQPREFTVCEPGPEGSATPVPEGTEINLTTLELVDDDPDNDTNVAALRFSAEVEDDRADGDETVGKVTTRSITTPSDNPDGCQTFTVSSNAAQIFTLMAFIDDVNAPAANDDNTNPPEYRDIAGQTTFGSSSSGLNMTPANDNNSTTVISRRNGQQIVYTVTAVDAQGQPLSGPIDVSFEQLTDGQPLTTTTAEFDWFDNSATPSTEEGFENNVPPGATPVGAGTTRIEVVPNADGEFTFAITNGGDNTAGTAGNPIAWIDVVGGRTNRPDANEPQTRGENFSFTTGTEAFATLEALGCPPGTDQRGWAINNAASTTDTPSGNNPFTMQDPCLGTDVLTADPHVPWELSVAAESDNANAATQDNVGDPVDPTDPPSTADPSRGDIVFRYTQRDATGRRLEDNPATTTSDENNVGVTFTILRNDSTTNTVAAAPNRPNAGSETSEPVLALTGIATVIDMSTNEGIAEIVVDANGSANVTVTAELIGTGATPIGGSDCAGTAADPAACAQDASWVNVSADTTDDSPPLTAGSTNCPSPLQPCFNGNLVAIDKARDYYVMNRGGTIGGTAYVVYAVGGGGEPYGRATATSEASATDTVTATNNGERPGGIDEYFLNGVPTPQDLDDNERCGFSGRNGAGTEYPPANRGLTAGDTGYAPAAQAQTPQTGCARFDAAMTFDDRMVYEWSGSAPTRTQSHFLTDGDS